MTTTYRLPLNELRERRDPVADSYERGREDGRQAALAEMAAQRAEEDAAREAITLAFARFDADSAKLLRERLHETVLALCEDLVLPMALDTDGLARRVEAAAAMLQRKTDERIVRLNPNDHPLVLPLIDPALTLVPDPSVERGSLRIDTDDGGVEDGPQQWRLAIAEALAKC